MFLSAFLKCLLERLLCNVLQLEIFDLISVG